MLSSPKNLYSMWMDNDDQTQLLWGLRPTFNPYGRMFDDANRLFQQGNFQNDAMFSLQKPLIKDGKFEANFDLRHYDPEAIKVKYDGGMLEVQAKQEKKSKNGDRYEYREFIQKVNVPKQVIEDQLKCKLDKDGRLRIEAPVIPLQNEQPKERDIPIQMINQNKKETNNIQ